MESNNIGRAQDGYAEETEIRVAECSLKLKNQGRRYSRKLVAHVTWRRGKVVELGMLLPSPSRDGDSSHSTSPRMRMRMQTASGGHILKQ